MSRLPNECFAKVIKNTPLVSIDFIIIDEHKKVLLGKRVNRPAKDYWFVPGGRILKDETFSNAFSRLSLVELGLELNSNEAMLLGHYDHFYDDNVFGENFSTHYIANAYKVILKEKDSLSLPLNQHQSFRWFHISELLTDNSVHNYTKAYFKRISL